MKNVNGKTPVDVARGRAKVLLEQHAAENQKQYNALLKLCEEVLR
jgi:hypothetical protein